MNQISRILKKPPLYEKSSSAFWDDEHISRQMLSAHLNPEFEGASRKMQFIEQSAAWINRLVPPACFLRLLDVGCGPGIYAEKFAGMGYQVTGVDISKRSIDHAQKSAKAQGLDIAYHYQDYLELDLNRDFDFAAMIYCDYGALSTADRQIILEKVRAHLRPGGKFLLDVFTMAKYRCFQEKQTWELCEGGGFWSKEGYVLLSGCYHYPENVTLEQYSLIADKGADVYYLWNTYFTEESLIKEAEAAGFQVCGIFGDVAGSPCHRSSATLAVLLEK